MTTRTDTQFTTRFAPMELASFVANQSALADYVPTTGILNTGMMSDIGRATVYGPDTQDNWYSRFMKAPLIFLQGYTIRTHPIQTSSTVTSLK